MATLLSQMSGTEIETPLMEMLNAPEIQPGQDASYQICKLIYEYHPLGAKMTETPIRMAMSQGREYTVSRGPETIVRDRFVDQWKKDRCNHHIFNGGTLSRVYGLSAIVMAIDGVSPKTPVTPKLLQDPKLRFSFNVLDPLNISGSLNYNQNPNATNFLTTEFVKVQGDVYHGSRAIVLIHGNPIYLGYTVSAFGYTGRSSYQRALYPLKSFIQTMRTDDLVAKKVGIIIAKLKQAGSVVNKLITTGASRKRALLKDAETGNVISIEKDEEIESLNLQNLDAPYDMSRKHILENIALCSDTPAKIINMETFAEGFGEGTEDAKNIAKWVDDVRDDILPLYEYFENLVMYRAWTPEFYEGVQEQYPEYKDVSYEEAFLEWKNSFEGSWPSFLVEPPSEKSKVDKVKLDAVKDLLGSPMFDKLGPEQQADFIMWAADNINEMKELFSSPLILDRDELLASLEEAKQQADEDREKANAADAENDNLPQAAE